MKNSIVFIGIAFVSLTNICTASTIVKKLNDSCHVVILAENNISNFEIIESANANKIEKTADELIAEDNAITQNKISNELQALDFYVISCNSTSDEVIESSNSYKIEKTANELIAEDNAITENNISNETYALDFEIINRKSKLVIGKNKSFLAID